MAPSGRSGGKAKPTSSTGSASQDKKQLRTRSAQAGLQVLNLTGNASEHRANLARTFSSQLAVFIVT